MVGQSGVQRDAQQPGRLGGVSASFCSERDAPAHLQDGVMFRAHAAAEDAMARGTDVPGWARRAPIARYLHSNLFQAKITHLRRLAYRPEYSKVVSYRDSIVNWRRIHHPLLHDF